MEFNVAKKLLVNDLTVTVYTKGGGGVPSSGFKYITAEGFH